MYSSSLIFPLHLLHRSPSPRSSIQAWATSSASSSTSPATPAIPVTRKTRTRRTTTATAGLSTSARSPSSWLNPWVFSQSTCISRKTKRRTSEPNATSSKPPRLLRRTLAFQVTATGGGARAPVRGQVTRPASPPRWGWRWVEEVGKEGWAWVCQWGIFLCTPSAGSLWRVEVRLEGPTVQRGTFCKSTTAFTEIWKMAWTGGPRQYEVTRVLPYKSISLMEDARYCTVDEKRTIPLRSCSGSNGVERSELKIFLLLRPSVPEKS